MRIWARTLGSLLLLLAASGCSRPESGEPKRILHMATAAQVKTLDPALAGDLASRNMAGALYDTLLQYNYTKRPYTLEPSMLAAMPEVLDGGATYVFTLRDDLFFVPDACFGVADDAALRRVTSRDVIASFLRIADGHLHSPVYWLWRGKVQGVEAFYAATATADAAARAQLYEAGIPGFAYLDETHFAIRLTRPDPRFLYNLAIPYTGVVSRTAVEFYGDEAMAEHPVGSGPFRLAEYRRDYRLILERNAEYREEYFPEAETPADRTRRLPLADRIECVNVRQSISAWLLFLQGELDLSALNKDNADLVAGGSTLSPALERRGVSLITNPEFEIQYVGFSFTDPRLANNLKLRQALAAAYNVPQRIRHANFLAVPIHGPIPPGVAGYEAAPAGTEAAGFDVERARKLLAEAGYPGGIDPATGAPLVIEFDQSGNSSMHRQQGEMAAANWGLLGIKVKVNLNNAPRFYEKLRQGKMQTFRLSWVGDYPDAENFLQLFYGKNAGGCNRVFYQDETFDRMFEEIQPLPDSPERTARYQEMARYITLRQPWIFESQPISFQLKHRWLENCRPHDFACNRWKYWSINEPVKAAMRQSFRPLSMAELREAPLPEEVK